MSPLAVLYARYDPVLKNLVLDLRNGAQVALPVTEIEELHARTADELASVEVSPAGDWLLWRSIDVGISVPGLLTDFFGRASYR